MIWGSVIAAYWLDNMLVLNLIDGRQLNLVDGQFKIFNPERIQEVQS